MGSHGMYLDKFAKKTVKVLVVGNPANTNAFICKKYAPSIPAENFSALTRLDQNRAQALIASKLGLRNGAVSKVVIWGSHFGYQFPDAAHAIAAIDGKEVKAVDALKDDAWVKGELFLRVRRRGFEVFMARRRRAPAMSLAKAICDHLRDWHVGTAPGEFVSMAVSSPGSYGIPKGTMYSFPVTIANGKWSIVEDLAIDDFTRKKMIDAL